MNVISMLTLNILGDDQNVFPYINYDTVDRFDVSKLEQWEIIFDHAQKLGLFLHIKLTEKESQGLLDHGGVGLNQKLYYREMVSRFGHHLALNWNLGEENGEWTTSLPTVPQDTAERHAMVTWFRLNDPYQHPVVIHNGVPFDDMLGRTVAMSGISLQVGPWKSNESVQHFRALSAAAGYPWLVAHDEHGPANTALPPDDIEPDHIPSRQGALWGALLGGAWGNEWYFGYNHPHSDLTCQDWRTRDAFWTQAAYALSFFADNKIRFWEMKPSNDLLSHRDGYLLARQTDTYVIFLKRGDTPTRLDLGSASGIFTGHRKEDYKGTYSIRWFNPRTGGALQAGSVPAITALGETPGGFELGLPPGTPDRDWVILVRRQQ